MGCRRTGRTPSRPARVPKSVKKAAKTAAKAGMAPKKTAKKVAKQAVKKATRNRQPDGRGSREPCARIFALMMRQVFVELTGRTSQPGHE
jgi:hypothetical protein